MSHTLACVGTRMSSVEPRGLHALIGAANGPATDLLSAPVEDAPARDRLDTQIKIQSVSMFAALGTLGLSLYIALRKR